MSLLSIYFQSMGLGFSHEY